MREDLGYIFAKGVTLREINPDNNALKNEFMDNLMTTCSMLLISADSVFDKISVVRGFISAGKLYNEILPAAGRSKCNQEEIRHTLGTALEITWEGFDPDKALDFCKEYIKLTDIPVKFIVYNNSLGFYRDVPSQKILRKLDDRVKVIIAEKEKEGA